MSPALDEPDPQKNPLQTPLKVGGDVLPPQKLYGPQPFYTEKAKRDRIQGVVILEAVVDEKGRVRAVKVLKGLPGGLTESAVNTVKKWRFKPATNNGEPVAVYFNLTTRFSLQQEQSESQDAGVGLNLPASEDVQLPVVVSAPPPSYTEGARQAGFQGVVVVLASIDKEGNVTNMKVLKGLPILDTATADAVKEWKFKPATLFGRPVAVVYKITVRFSLDQAESEAVEVDLPLDASFQSSEGVDVQPPVKVSAPSPQYNEVARKARIQGVVITEGIIDKTGSVTNVKVLKGLPLGLSEAAALAVCQFQFKPATLNGKPVAVIYKMTTNFRLE